MASTAPSPDDFVLYRYHPSLAAAIIFITCFIITTFIHAFQMAKKNTWYFVPLIIGGVFEWVGYIGRALSSKDQEAFGPFIMQTLLLLVAPALFAASIYMVLGRIIILVDGERHSIIAKRWLTKAFVCGDILSFILQASGGGIMAGKSLDSVRLGGYIVVVGLFVQIIFFGFFMVVALIFHKRIYKYPTGLSSYNSPIGSVWQKYLYTLYAASALIMVRSIFRVIEYSMGNGGFLLRNEVFLYVFDAVLMLGVMVLFNIIHPSGITGMQKQRNGQELDDFSHENLALRERM